MHDPVKNLIAELEKLVFTAARNWERRVTIHHADRDAIIHALRFGSLDESATGKLREACKIARLHAPLIKLASERRFTIQKLDEALTTGERGK